MRKYGEEYDNVLKKVLLSINLKRKYIISSKKVLTTKVI